MESTAFGFDDGGFSFFTMFPIFFTIMFVIVIGMILFSVFKGVSTWSRNNAQPVLSVEARVVSKRTEQFQHSHESNHHAGHTTHYATFQVESGDRMEFSLAGKEFGLLAEGDMGKLTFQGTRYHGFERYR